MAEPSSSSSSSEPPRLHFGWQLDVVGDPPPKIPVLLDAKGLKSHTAIIAQSGSGKSFALGRLLEEIASRTHARVVVLDPNSDFVRFSDIDKSAWKKEHLIPWFASDDTLTKFRKRWKGVGVRTVTGSKGRRRANVSGISIRWGDLSETEMAAYLGFSWSDEAAEMRVISDACEVARTEQKKTGMVDKPFTLEEFAEAVDTMWGSVEGLNPDPEPYDFPPSVELAGLVTRDFSRVSGRCEDLLHYEMWDRGSETPLYELFDDMTKPNTVSRVLTLDLPSLPSQEARLCATQAVLDSIETSTRLRWGEAMKANADTDKRSPTFIVIDEAHNLAPSEPSSPRAEAVTDSLITIAAEGRKFGLFLILVTQRPSRLHPSILSQCDNLCLLRMNNRHDLELVEKSFGFVPEGWVDRALEFGVGDCLLAGNFVNQPVYAHVAPRRTVEGGRNLQDAHWTKDPLDEDTGA